MSSDGTLPSSSLSILSGAELAQLDGVGATRQYASGAVVFRQSEPGTSMYVVEEGAVDLVLDDGTVARRLSLGGFFGELALLSAEFLRTATAVAVGDTRLRVLDQQAFNGLLQSKPELLVALLKRSCSYLLESEQRLILDLRRRNRELEQTLDYLRRTREELDQKELMLQTDELTGVYNRRCLNKQVGTFLSQAADKGSGLALVLADVDDLKVINDRLGHPAGDRVLKRFSDLLRNGLRWSDLPCRIGGDEFAVLISDIDNEEASGRAAALFESIGRFEVRLPDERVEVTASMGGATYRPDQTWSEFFETADRNLYQAKGHGRHRLSWNGAIVER